MALVVLLGVAPCFAVGNGESECSDDLWAAQLNLSAVTLIEMRNWPLSRFPAFRARLDRELQAAAVEVNGRIPPRLTRYTDLYLLSNSVSAAEANASPGLEAAGITVADVSLDDWTNDFKEKGDGQMSPITRGRRMLVVGTELGYRIISRMMQNEALTPRFSGWNIYKVRFLFPNSNGQENRVDWIPAHCKFKDESEYAVIIKSVREGLTHEEYSLGGELELRQLEASFAHDMDMQAGPMALAKVKALGWSEVLEVFPDMNESQTDENAVALLKAGGYFGSPFHADEQFWTRDSAHSDRVIKRVIAALRWMKANQHILVPSGFMPESEIAGLRQAMRVSNLRRRSVYRGFLEQALSFSGPKRIEEFSLQFPPGDEGFFHRIHSMENKLDYINRSVKKILNAQGMEAEEIQEWLYIDWPQYDLLRSVEYMANRGFVYDETTDAWVKKSN